MAPQVPTTTEIKDNIIAQLEISLNQSIPLLPKAFNRVLAKAIAGIVVVLYKYGGFIFLQMFVTTATIKETLINGVWISPLKEWGRLIGVGDPAAATKAEMIINITVENQTGTLPSNSQLVNSDNGVTYITIGSVLLDSAVVQATIRAASDQTGGGGSGEIGNLDIGATVSFANPLPNVARDATIASQTVTGADGESTEAYLQRILDRFQKRPQGGALADYEIWGEEPAGILNIFPYTGACPGQVDVYVESATETDGIPTEAQLQEVLDSINLNENGLASRRPANALANTFPIERIGFNVVVSGLSVDDSAQVQIDITKAADEYFKNAAPFIPGLSVLPRKDIISRNALAGDIDDIVTAAGGVFDDAIILLDVTPTPQYPLGIGEKSKSLSVTFTA